MKRKSVNRLFALLLSGSMLAAVMTGCGNSESKTDESVKNSAGTEESQSESVKDSGAETVGSSEEASKEDFDPKSIAEGVTITIAIPENVKVENHETNDMTLMIEEALGVNLEFEVYPSADYTSKLNLMVMTGDELPDIIMNPSSVDAWAAEGALIDLTEYYENPDLSATIRQAGELAGVDFAQQLRTADGKIYAAPAYSGAQTGVVWEKPWVYTPWLDAVGLDVPVTTEEFYEACKLVCESDPNGNGKKDEIAFTDGGFGNSNDAWFNCLMSAFIYAHDSEYRVVEDGQISFAYTTDAWKEGLKYIRRFFEEGLVPEEALTQDSTQYQAQVYSDVQTVFAFFGWQLNGTDLERKAGMMHIPALKGPEGVQYAMYKLGTANQGAVITSDCENPEVAFLVLDYMCGEEMSISQRYGKRGVNWDYWDEAKVDDRSRYSAKYDGYDISIIVYDDASFWGSTETQNVSWLQVGPQVIDKTIFNGIAILTDVSTPEEEMQLKITTGINNAVLDCLNYSPDEVIVTLPLTEKENEATSDIKATLKNYLTESICAFLVGSKDIDAEWDAYLAELERIGYQTVLDVYQTAYDRVNGK